MLNKTGVRMHSISSVEKIEEIFGREEGNIVIVDRLFNSSLVVLVTETKPNCLIMVHFKKNQDICHCVYPSPILSVRMNRHRLVVCLAEGFHIHAIRDMKNLHSIPNIPPPNLLGMCSLSWNSQLAYPIQSETAGVLRIFNGSKLKPGLTIKAHETTLSAINFSPSGLLIATASERGTVIRVFCVKNGQRVQEFRRGVKRCVTIASLVFDANAEFICASSNTETVHIFKIDQQAVESATRKSLAVETITQNVDTATLEDLDNTLMSHAHQEPIADLPLPMSIPDSDSADDTDGNNSWSGYLSKAVSSYIPSQVYDVLNQDRAFATAVLSQPGLKHVCGLTRIQKELKLLVACEDGFLYIYDFDETKGGNCKLLRVHDLRSSLEGDVVGKFVKVFHLFKCFLII